MIRLPTHPRSQLLFIAIIAALSMAVYLAASPVIFRLGFPLDDAWIHQTYARNLAQRGEWAFQPGQPSAGSTAPLWSLWLSIGYLLRLGPYIWTFFTGWLCLAAVGWQGAKIFRALAGRLFPDRNGKMGSQAIWAALFLVLEYHLVWAAASGMETLLYAALILAVLAELSQPQPRWARLGLLIGISIWVRPDGITLLGPAVWVLVFMDQTWRQRWRGLWALGVGVGALILLYMMFNLKLSGNWLPNTFFAKQAEYAIQRQAPLWKRWFDQAYLLIIGAGALLLPGLGLYILRVIRTRCWAALAGFLWLGGYLLLYAIRLPVVYQHGRYIMPAMPVYFVWSLVGFMRWLQFKNEVWGDFSRWSNFSSLRRFSNNPLLKRVVSKAWAASLALALIAFWGLGAWIYARDVAIIESEMVDTARWIAENTDPQAIVAAHDIGAVGYFGRRRLLDLAGLVSPEVIPFIRDEDRLLIFLHMNQADYLVTFPGWYPSLIQAGNPVHVTNAVFSPAAGGENMAVYALK